MLRSRIGKESILSNVKYPQFHTWLGNGSITIDVEFPGLEVFSITYVANECCMEYNYAMAVI